MVEAGSQIPFRESTSQAPEFSQPFKANTLFGVQYWPFQEIQTKDDGSIREKVVFEAHGRPSEETDPLIVRVSYEAPYGLKAKRTIVLRQFPDSELLIQSGEVRYSFGELDISIAFGLGSPIVTPEIARNPENFKATIGVLVDDEQIPPLAYIDYHFSSQIPINVQFPYADYEEALKGEVEKREKQGFAPSSYRYTYFGWENLVGAKVGITRYDDPKDDDYLRHYRWFTRINSPEPVQLEGSPYKQKVSRSEAGWYWGEGRLRFSRMNIQTRESWMFSVPEWIDKGQFHNDIQYLPLTDFFWKYPVVLCVKRRGEERKWFSTHSNHDKARR